MKTKEPTESNIQQPTSSGEECWLGRTAYPDASRRSSTVAIGKRAAHGVRPVYRRSGLDLIEEPDYAMGCIWKAALKRAHSTRFAPVQAHCHGCRLNKPG